MSKREKFEIVEEESGEIFTQQDLIKHALDKLFSDRNILMTAEVKPGEVQAYTTLYLLNKVYGFRELWDLALLRLKLSVSKNRQSRRELIELVKPPEATGGLTEEIEEKSIRQKLREIFE